MAEQKLRLIENSSNKDISYYEIRDNYDGPIKRYVVSTPETREICTRPEVMAFGFTDGLTSAVTKALGYLPEAKMLGNEPQQRVCAINFLRGGENFNVRKAIHDAWGFDHHGSGFESCAREVRDGKWHVKVDYTQFEPVQNQATIIIGDIVATGSTLYNGIGYLRDYLKQKGRQIKNMVYITIGGRNTEEELAKIDAEIRKANSQYGTSSVVYLEARFALAKDTTPLLIKKPGTDLLNIPPALLAPEFVRQLYNDESNVIQGCAIYDGGSRSMDIPRYIDEVTKYFKEVKSLAHNKEFTLEQAVHERWPDKEWSDKAFFFKKYAKQWEGINRDILSNIYGGWQIRWADVNRKDFESPHGLVDVCNEVIERLPRFDNGD